MNDKQKFDCIIIGGGLAGLQLALAFLKDPYFNQHSIAIIEPSNKKQNDKTWCFWEVGKGKWEDLLYHQWKKGKFIDDQNRIELDMQDYSYKMIRSVDFYQHSKALIESSRNIDWVTDTIEKVEGENCVGQEKSYTGTLIFDSRIDSKFYHSKKSINILQHFKGWVIKTENDFFDPETFTMMDYRLSYKDWCSFTYVLPFSKNTALVESTFFTPEKVPEKVYDELLEKYIKEHLKLINWKLIETEIGTIPMSSYPFHKENRDHYLKIGTAGGWVKASTGYSFKRTERNVEQLIENIKNKSALSKGLLQWKHQLYDRIFLRVLHNENHLGNNLFQQMYTNNKAHEIFNFLDETSTIKEEMKIINSFKKAPFLRSLSKEFL